MELTDLAELVKGRRAVRRWADRDVPEELLIRAVELATWAPNAGNKQTWKFFVILNKGIISRVADAVQASANLMASWPESRQFGGEVETWRERGDFIRSAPAAIAVAAGEYISLRERMLAARDKSDPEQRKIAAFMDVANPGLQSAAAATSYLLLILHQMGLGSVWMTSPMQAKDKLEALLNVPPKNQLVAYMPVGYPAGPSGAGTRMAVKDVCSVLR